MDVDRWASLANCPVEIVTDIFELACTDDGSTWPSLSVVSRGFHNLSTPCMFLSLTVSNKRKMSAVLARLRNAAPAARRVVQLFLSCNMKCVPEYDGSYPLGEDIGGWWPLPDYENILRIVAPTLEYLVTDLDLACFLDQGSVFPRLRELCVRTCTTNLLETSGPRVLPALRILQVQALRGASEERLRILRKSLAALATVAPDLEHLRLGDVLAYCEHLSPLRLLLGIVLSTPKTDFTACKAGPHDDLLWKDLRGRKKPLNPPPEFVIHSLFPKLRRFHVDSKRNREARFISSTALTLLQGLDAQSKNLLVVHRPDSEEGPRSFEGDLLRNMAWQDWSMRANGRPCGCTIGSSTDLPCARVLY